MCYAPIGMKLWWVVCPLFVGYIHVERYLRKSEVVQGHIDHYGTQKMVCPGDYSQEWKPAANIEALRDPAGHRRTPINVIPHSEGTSNRP